MMEYIEQPKKIPYPNGGLGIGAPAEISATTARESLIIEPVVDVSPSSSIKHYGTRCWEYTPLASIAEEWFYSFG